MDIAVNIADNINSNFAESAILLVSNIVSINAESAIFLEIFLAMLLQSLLLIIRLKMWPAILLIIPQYL